MYEVLCERCWHTESLDDEHVPDYACPGCGSEHSWLGPFAETPQRFSRRDGWPLLTSPLYMHAGQPERRMDER